MIARGAEGSYVLTTDERVALQDARDAVHDARSTFHRLLRQAARRRVTGRELAEVLRVQRRCASEWLTRARNETNRGIA